MLSLFIGSLLNVNFLGDKGLRSVLMIPIPLRSEIRIQCNRLSVNKDYRRLHITFSLCLAVVLVWIFNCVGLCKLICVMTGECPRGQWVVTGVQRPVSDLKMEREDPVWVS